MKLRYRSLWPICIALLLTVASTVARADPYWVDAHWETYVVPAHWEECTYWVDGHWEDEHADPDDPDAVTGTFWVEGYYATSYQWMDETTYEVWIEGHWEETN